MLLLFYSIFITVSWVAVSIYLLVNARKVSFLKDVATPPFQEPSVAIIIAVKDEEAEVEEALKSVCRLQYSNLKIIVINDRSTDNTPAILNKMAEANTQLTLININHLPQGWLGKNNALYQGYLATKADWLLFTDADILYNEQALRKAMQYAVSHGLDHLTVMPQIISRSKLFKSVMNTFGFMLELKLRPWAVSKPSSSASIGIGAFNMVKRAAYEKAGTHKAISLRPDDDLKLGKRIKRAGLKQDVLYGDKEISLQWYTSLRAFVNGLMKNTFSVTNYNLPLVLFNTILTFVVFVLPLPLLLLSGYPYNGMAALIVAAQLCLVLFKKGGSHTWWHALMIPFAGLVMVYIFIKSTFVTIKQGGIYWRDSFYSLDELRKQK